MNKVIEIHKYLGAETLNGESFVDATFLDSVTIEALSVGGANKCLDNLIERYVTSGLIDPTKQDFFFFLEKEKGVIIILTFLIRITDKGAGSTSTTVMADEECVAIEALDNSHRKDLSVLFESGSFYPHEVFSGLDKIKERLRYLGN